MDSLLIFLLLLEGTSDRPSIDASSGQSRVQAMASVRILGGAAIDFDLPVNRRGARAIEDGGNIFQIAPTRSTAEPKALTAA